MGYSIGISAYFHESSVSLFRDGEMIEFSREEYFSRIKGDNNFPRLTIRYLLEKYCICEKEVDYVVFYEKPLLSFLNITLYALRYFPDSRKLIYNNLIKIRQSGLFFSSDVKKYLKIPNRKIIYCPHHLSHVLSTFPFLPDQPPHVSIVIDGVGDISCTSIYEVDNGNVKFLNNVEYPFSLGLIYSSVTDYLGFNINDGEYKVMALASYGTGRLNEKFKTIVGKDHRKINLKNFSYYKSIEKSYGDGFIDIFGINI
jgi:carbamoyltransferase